MTNYIIAHWEQIALGYLIIHNILKGIRDAVDSTPETDDTPFEKFVTAFNKFSLYFITGKRA